MARRLATAVAAASMLYTGSVMALGLGDITPSSGLNQSFDAEIALTGLDELSEQEIIVSLASPADFERVGIERLFFLSELTFNVRVANGRGVISVRSPRPITEPFVNFLVEVIWPSGRLQKEFTVLLDPPPAERARERVQPAVSPPRTTAAPVRPRSRPAGGDDAVAARDRSERASDPSVTGWGDTLWAIARRVRPQGASIEQTMLAIVEANPDAFIGGNVNLLKAGVRLTIPDADAVSAIGRADAATTVAEHARRWKSGDVVADGPQTSVGAPAVAAAPAVTEPAPAVSDELVLSGPATPAGPAADAAAAAASSAATSSPELDASREEQDALRRDLEDARKALAEQQQRNDAIAAEAAAREAELASLRSELGSAQKPPAAAAPNLFTSWPGMALIGLVALLAAVVVFLLTRVRGALGAAQAAEAARAQASEKLEQTVRMAPAAAATGATAAVSARAAATARPTPASTTQRTRPTVRAPASADATGETQPVSRRRTEPAAPPPAVPSKPADDEVSKTVILPEAERVPVRTTPRNEDVVTVDVAGEADIYIAYGRFPQAISFLRAALEKEPDRNDVRLKLMEVLVETKDVAAFTAEAQQLLSRNPVEGELRRARQLQARLPGADAISLERVDAPAGPDFDKTVIDTSLATGTARIAPAAAAAAVALDVNLDETEALTRPEAALPLDVDLSDPSAVRTPVAPSTPAAPSASAELDFDLTLDGVDEQARPTRDQLGGDLGIDFRDEPAAPPPAVDADDASGLDLTVDGRRAPVAPARRAAMPAAGAGLDDTRGLDLTLDADATAEKKPAVDPQLANAQTVETTAIDEEELDFLSDTDEASTKLDLARAYVDMGDVDGAREILNEVVNEGNDAQKREAQELIARLK